MLGIDIQDFVEKIKQHLIKTFVDIPTEKILEVIDLEIDLSKAVENYLNRLCQDPNLKELVIGYLRYFWKDIEENLKYEKIFAEIVTYKPDLLKHLNKKRKEYLKNQIEKIRNLLFKFAWE